ncbi:MAG: stage III sporulation protein AB [Clostridia bacterium]|nr:stage III sporulation protein AB [Clostridia bacterium]
MHFFRWLGVGVILCCGIFSGLFFAAFERRRLEQAEGFLSLLRLIRLQIDCFSAPVSRILAECDKSVLAACGIASPKTDFKALLRDTKLYLSEEMCRLLTDFAGRLGGSYREEQLRCCEYYLARLAPYCDTLRAELPKRERMALFLPPALSVALILLLL